MKLSVGSIAWSVALLMILSPELRGEVVVVKDYNGQEGLTLYKMTVTPSAEPKPALKHRLRLRSHEYKPGNAATYYLQTNAQNDLNGTWKSVRKEFGEAVDDWYRNEIPLSELPLDKMRRAASRFDSLASNFIVPASTRQDCDWGYHFAELRGAEVYSLLLPGAQQSRSIARMLSLRTRLAIAEGRYDDALDHMRMNYRLARNIGKEPILVCGLVGIAIQGVTNVAVIDLIASPDSPNLYWALTELPRPLVDMREAVCLEMSAYERVFPILLNPETAEHTPQEWALRIARAMDVSRNFSGSPSGIDNSSGNLALRLAVAGSSLIAYPAAKQRLLRTGVGSQRVEQMPVGQVLAVDAAREYRLRADELEKWWYVPYPAARHRMREAERGVFEGNLHSGFGSLLAGFLMPAIRAVHAAQIRIEWQMNALRLLEALRMHAAETGQFPNSLEQIQGVPVPRNPVTTQPYLYWLEGQTAVVELPLSDGIPGVAHRYEMTLVKNALE